MDDPAGTTRRATIIAARVRGEAHLDAATLAAIAGLSPAMLARLVRLGVVEPLAPGGDVFSAATAGRLRRMLRLRQDLGVGLFGAAVIVDLMEHLERLEAELNRLRPPG